MANSAFKAIINYVAGNWHGDGAPFGAGEHRIAVNNAIHYADEAMQVRCNWVAHTTSDYLVPDATSSSDTWYRLFSQKIPLTLRKDGTGPVLRVRVAGSSSQGNAVTFRLVVSSEFGAPIDVLYAPADLENVEAFTTSSQTMAWITGGATTITVPPDRLEAMRTSETVDTATLTMVAGIEWHLANVEVWAAVTGITSTPRLGGVYVAEYVGT